MLTASEASETNEFSIFKSLFMIMFEIRVVRIPSASKKYSFNFIKGVKFYTAVH